MLSMNAGKRTSIGSTCLTHVHRGNKNKTKQKTLPKRGLGGDLGRLFVRNLPPNELLFPFEVLPGVAGAAHEVISCLL